MQLVEKLKKPSMVIIETCGNDQKALFKVINEILHTTDNQPLSSIPILLILKIPLVISFNRNMQGLERTWILIADSDTVTAITSVLPLDELPPPASFTTFETLIVKEIKNIIAKSPSQSCAIDLVSTWLLKELGDIPAPVITKIITLSLQTGSMPLELKKKALVMPLLKKRILDMDIFKDYRSVSNLTFVLKIIEKAGLCYFQNI